MKNKILCLALIFFIVISPVGIINLNCFAESENASLDILLRLGIFIGEGNGLSEEYLKKNPTRAQAAVVYLRLCGKAEEAKSFDVKDNFSDAEDAQWAKPYLAYIKANFKDSVKSDKFLPNEKITSREGAKALLSALGFVYDLCYTDETMEEFALGRNIIINDNKEYTVNDFANSALAALKARKRGANGLSLLAVLIEQNDGIKDEIYINKSGIDDELLIKREAAKEKALQNAEDVKIERFLMNKYGLGKTNFETENVKNPDFSQISYRQSAYEIIKSSITENGICNIELDFSNFSDCFNGGAAYDENVERMNNFIRSIRDMSETVACETKNPIVISVLTGDLLQNGYEECKKSGLDVEKWLEEGLVDIVK